MESFSSSYQHNKSMRGSPVGRIVVTGPKILYKNKEYSSASDALLDYIHEFQENTPNGKPKPQTSDGYSRDVLDLLMSRSSKRGTDELESRHGVSLSSEELEKRLQQHDLQSSGNSRTQNITTLQNSRSSIEDAYRKMLQVDNAIHVADALNKSHEVLQKVDEDSLSDVVAVSKRSDLQSVATESLISVNVPSTLNMNLNLPQERPRGHIYSYKTPLTRAHTVSDVSFNRPTKTPFSVPNNYGAQLFTNSASQDTKRATLSERFSSAANSFPLPKEQLGRPLRSVNISGNPGPRFRSRSISPSVESGRFCAPSWVEDLDRSTGSWHTATDLQRNTFRDIKGGRRTPSWIEDIFGSTASSVTPPALIAPTTETGLQDLCSISYVSDASELRTSISSTASSLKMSDLDLVQGSNNVRKEKSSRTHSSGYVHVKTSTPLKKAVSMPNKREAARDSVLPDDALLPSFPRNPVIDACTGSRPLTDSRLRDNTNPISKLGGSKINQMLRELDVIREKLKSSSEDTHNCLQDLTCKPKVTNPRELTTKRGSTNLVNDVYQDERTATIGMGRFHGDLDKSQSLASGANLAAISSISKVHDQATRTLSMGEDLRSSSPQSALTDDILEGDRPWEKPIIKQHRTPSPASSNRVQNNGHNGKGGVIQDFLNDCLQNDQHPAPQWTAETLSGGPQPGSMEALKNMLFKLQSEASSINNTDIPGLGRDNGEQRSDVHLSQNLPASEEISPVTDGNPLDDYTFKAEPGGQCLERALEHLSRLKTLVQSDTFNPETRAKSSTQSCAVLNS